MSCGLLTQFLLKTNYGHKVRKRVRIHSGYILVDVENNNIHSHNIEHAGASKPFMYPDFCGSDAPDSLLDPQQLNCLKSAGNLIGILCALLIRAANDPSVFTITEKAAPRAFSWLKVPTSAFTFKTLLRHYAKEAPKHHKQM